MRNEQVIEVLDAKLSGFKAEIKAGHDMTAYKLDQLIEYQEKQNGRTSMLEKETYFFRLTHRHPKISIIAVLILAAAFTFSTVYISHHVNAKKTIENRTGIVID